MFCVVVYDVVFAVAEVADSVFDFVTCNSPKYPPVRLSVECSVGPSSVCHNFLKGLEVKFPIEALVFFQESSLRTD